jgi:uncharacterized damage-inducible protein DinB
MTNERVDPPLQGDEVATLRGFLDYYRHTIRIKTAGLDQAQLTTTLGPSTMTLGGLLKHLAVVEESWFVEVVAGGTLGEPWASVDWEADRDWEWHTAKDDTPEDLLALFDRAVAGSDAILEQALAKGTLDSPSAAPSRHSGEHFSLRWILVHLIEEYARHAGHADLLRESIDGQVGD